ncbi:MAG: hypothetical protein Q7J16_05315 [Candidatus Cloacimonadales bacterium]|nr:hypothetical protein [Candidatus Cloacimonadales bacterium]
MITIQISTSKFHHRALGYGFHTVCKVVSWIEKGDFKTSLYCIANALMKAKIGELKNGFSFAGANAWRVDKIISVKELMDSLVREFELAVLKSKPIFSLASIASIIIDQDKIGD